MNHGFVRVAAASLRMYLGEIEKNEKAILSAIEALEKQGAEVALFPALTLTGVTLGDLVLQEHYQRRALDALCRIAGKTKDMAAILGLPFAHAGRLYHCAAVVQGGRVQGLVPQRFPNPRQEGRWFQSGAELNTTVCIGGQEIPLASHLRFDLPGFSFAVEMGGDLLSPLPPDAEYVLAGTDLIFVPFEDSTYQGREKKRRSLLSQHSERLCAGFVCACPGFGESTGDRVYGGYTGLFEMGHPLAEGALFQEEGDSAIGDIDIYRLRHQRQRSGNFFSPLPEKNAVMRPVKLSASICPNLPLLREIQPFPFLPQGDRPEATLEEIAKIQAAGLKTRLRAIHCDQLVVGVSGGLDSTLALLIAAFTMDEMGYPRKNIHGISMPGMGTGKRTRNNAEKLMKALNIHSQEISIEKSVLQHFEDIGQDQNLHDTTYENAQARERTQILMDLANRFGGIVLGTGDLSESALGFCTFNGDHMSMYNVNASIPKTLVKTLVRHLSERHFGSAAKAVCHDILDTPISPELLPDPKGNTPQHTEDILGSYDLHDFFLYHFLDSGADFDRLYLLSAQAFGKRCSEEKRKEQLQTFLQIGRASCRERV